MESYKKLDWDSGLFGYEVYLIKGDLTRQELQSILYNINGQKGHLVYWVTKGEKTFAADHRGTLVDVKVIYTKVIAASDDLDPSIRSFGKNEDFHELIPLSFQSGMYSRFKTDCNFCNNEFEKLYTHWIKKSVSREIADELFVYQEKGEMLGFVTVAIHEDKGVIGLIAVDERARGKRIGRKLLKKAETFAVSKGCNRMDVATQLGNSIACAFYERNHYNISHKDWVYHFWLR